MRYLTGLLLTVDWEVSTTIQKTFVGERHHSWKFEGQIIFKNLTLNDRRILGLPIEKPNPQFNPEEPESETNMRMILMTDKDKIEIIKHSEHIPPLENMDEVKLTINNRMLKQVQKYADRLKTKPKENFELPTNEVFKDKLTK